MTPAVTHAQTSYTAKDDALSSLTSSSSIHSGTQALELLLSKDVSYLNTKPSASNGFTEEQAEYHSCQHIFMTMLA